uniref:Uncharacterized protein n=1 Tax=Glossina austeni TaxID=7395 RepID=A0A1A9UD31_GLOAU
MPRISTYRSKGTLRLSVLAFMMTFINLLSKTHFVLNQRNPPILLYQNVRGLNTKFQELYPSSVGCDYYIIILSERWLKPKSWDRRGGYVQVLLVELCALFVRYYIEKLYCVSPDTFH